MQFFRTNAYSFWILACLFMVTGGSLHACVSHCEAVCEASNQHPHGDPHEHSSDEDPSNSSEPSLPQHCCHLHVQGSVPAISQPFLKAPLQLTALLSIANISTPEAPVWEIEYPPQVA